MVETPDSRGSRRVLPADFGRFGPRRGALFPPRQRVMRLDQRLEPLAEHMGIDLRRRDIGVAEHLLDAAQIGAVVEEMAGEGVAQHMRRDAPGIDAGEDGEVLEELAAAPPREMALRTARWKEEARGLALGEELAAPRRIGGKREARRLAERDETLLAALALDGQEAVLAQPRQRQRDELGDAQAGGVEPLDETDPPPVLSAVHPARCGAAARHLRLRQNLGQRPPKAGRIELRRRIVATHPLGPDEYVELAQ